MKARLDPPKAITATAHKLARLIYCMLRFGTEYVDRGQDYYERRYQSRILSSLARRAQELGYTLVKNEDFQPAASSTGVVKLLLGRSQH
jgi:transposase